MFKKKLMLKRDIYIIKAKLVILILSSRSKGSIARILEILKK